MPSPSWWKEFYAHERASLGPVTLEQFILDAPALMLPECGALIFPHTRLAFSGHLIAGAARAVLESGSSTVLALGVLHGIDRKRTELRGIHARDDVTHNEFSLDNFRVMLEYAARILVKPLPELIIRYPFLSGTEPESLPGYDELAEFARRGAAIVATGDMVHHGAGYETLKDSRLARESDEAKDYAAEAILGQLALLDRRDYPQFLHQCESARSDFRDVGPVLSSLCPSGGKHSIVDLTLVNYADVLHAEEPTWVAAALATFGTN